MGLALAIALDDTLAAGLGIVTPAPPVVAQVAAEEADRPDTKEEAEPTRTRRGLPLALTPLALVSAGLTPNFTGGAALSFDLRPRDHFDLRLGPLAVHESGAPLGTGSVDVTLAAGRVDLCWGTLPRSVRLRLCGGLAAGATISRGRGFSENSTRTTPWFAAIAGLDVAVQIVGPLALALRIDGVFPFQRTRIDVSNESDVVIDSEQLLVAGLVVGVGPRFEF